MHFSSPASSTCLLAEEVTCFRWAGQLPLEVCFGTLTSLLRLPAHPPSTTSSPENKPEGRLPPLKFPKIQVSTLEIPGFLLVSPKFPRSLLVFSKYFKTWLILLWDLHFGYSCYCCPDQPMTHTLVPNQ